MERRPFIVIASLMRCGSTLMQEMLSSDETYIFHEPAFHQNKIAYPKIYQEELQEEFGIDFQETISGLATTESIIGVLNNSIPQLGVKEILLEKWETYLKIPDTKFVLMGRDPRDIYLSIFNRIHHASGHQRFNPIGKIPLSPKDLAQILAPNFKEQQKIFKLGPERAIKVRYEDLCTDAEVFRQVARFVNFSGGLEAGKIGRFHNRLLRGSYENALHDGKVTQFSIARWRQKRKAAVNEQSNEFMRQMDKLGYRSFWGYDW